MFLAFLENDDLTTWTQVVNDDDDDFSDHIKVKDYFFYPYKRQKERK